MTNYPKKIKLIRDKYPAPVGTIYTLAYAKYGGINNAFRGYVEDAKKDEKEEDDNYNRSCEKFGMLLMRAYSTYTPCYISDSKDTITLEEATNTYWFEPVKEQSIEMSLEEVREKLGIDNLIIKSTK